MSKLDSSFPGASGWWGRGGCKQQLQSHELAPSGGEPVGEALRRHRGAALAGACHGRSQAASEMALSRGGDILFSLCWAQQPQQRLNLKLLLKALVQLACISW